MTQKRNSLISYRIDSIQQIVFALSALLLMALMPYSSASADNPMPHDASGTQRPTCMHIASYALGYAWQKGINRGIKQTLKGRCHLHTFYMDSKKVIDKTELKTLGQLAKQRIEALAPDIVIVSDDNAVNYVLKAHFKDHKIPFIFCGVNTTAQHYDLPYSNATGMIELSALKLILRKLIPIEAPNTHIAFLSSKGTTANKNAHDFAQVTEQLNLQGEVHQVTTQAAWRSTLKSLQNNPSISLIVLDNITSLPRWDRQKNIDWGQRHNHKLTVSTQPWMMDYAAIGITKSADEQGEWAGLAALSVLNGTPITALPIVPNHRFETYINPRLAQPFMELIPRQLSEQAVTFMGADD